MIKIFKKNKKRMISEQGSFGQKSITLIDNQDRKKLGEGRNQGFGGGFAKFDPKKNALEMIMPLTACADFYAEVIHSEATGKDWSVYGFKTKQLNLFKNTDSAYLVCGILPVNHGDKHANFDKEAKALEENYKNIESLINWFEDKLGVKQKTVVTKIGENRFLFKFDLFWTKGTYLISLYKFLQRAAIYYNGKENPIEHFDNLKNGALKDSEAYAWKAIKPKILDMLNGFIPEQKMTAQDTCPHNLGIQTFKWPRPLKT